MRRLFARPEATWLLPALAASMLLAGAIFVPLWRMALVAPQYPRGLVMHAYGYKFADDQSTPYDDVREINELNHYIGMKPIKPVTEMRLFVPGIIALVVATLVGSWIAWQRRWLRRLLILGFWTMPVFFVADLQFWLYRYGHTMDPSAALNTGPFTPKVFGTTRVWNFHSETRFELGFYLMVAAALVITAAPPLARLAQRRRTARRVAVAGREPPATEPRGGRVTAPKALIFLLAAALPLLALARADAQAPATEPLTLQQRIDAAAPDDIIVVDGGTFHERITINKPISLIGRRWPVVDGDGQGDVVTITASDAAISGFVIQGSGRSISREPAAVKVKDADRVKVAGNRIRRSHFGIHITGSKESVIEANELDTGVGTPVERRGHAIYLWEVSGSAVYRNDVRRAADGIHLEFSSGNVIGENRVRDSRYAVHLMYADHNKIVRNAFTGNLSGAILMSSREVVLKDNELSGNRAGATGAGILLKDADNIFAEGNRLLRNRYALFIEGTPQTAGATAIFRMNVLALNDVGIGLSSNAPITFVENAVIDNGVQVKALSGDLTGPPMSEHGGAAAQAAPAAAAQLPVGAVWSSSGRGNYWSDYRGYDADGDGVGDQPYRPRPAFAGRLARRDGLRLFQFTPAQQAIDLAADLFPIYRYRAVIEDGYPLTAPPAGLALPDGGSLDLGLLVLSVALLAGSAGVIAVASGGPPRVIGARGVRGARSGGAPA